MDKEQKIALVHAAFRRTIEDPTWWGFEEKPDMVIVTSPQGEEREMWFVCDCGRAYAACECPELENRKNVFPINVPMVNAHGNIFGTLWILFAKTQKDASTWVHQNLEGPDGEPYWRGRAPRDQCRVEIITRHDRNGARSCSPWWIVLKEFAKGTVTDLQLRKIADQIGD